MEYVNVGVRDTSGQDIPTKAALKRMIADDPSSVLIYQTSYGFENYWPDRTYVADLSESDKYSVAGPNPYTSRKWFATIAFNAKTQKWVVS